MNKELEKKFDEEYDNYRSSGTPLTKKEYIKSHIDKYYIEREEVFKIAHETNLYTKQQVLDILKAKDKVNDLYTEITKDWYSRSQVLDMIGENKASRTKWEEIDSQKKAIIASYGYNQAKAEIREKL